MRTSTSFATLLAIAAAGAQAAVIERAALTPFNLVPLFPDEPTLLQVCLDNNGKIVDQSFGPCGEFTLGNPLLGHSLPFAPLKSTIGSCSVAEKTNKKGDTVDFLDCSADNEGASQFVEGIYKGAPVLEQWLIPATNETQFWSSNFVDHGRVFTADTKEFKLVLQIVTPSSSSSS